MDVEEVHTPHKPHTGHRWLDVILGLTALLVSGISLSVAVHHGHIMEKLVEANSFPNLEIQPVVTAANDGAAFALAVENTGTGPARVDSLELWINGKAVTTSLQLLNAVLPADSEGRYPEVNVEATAFDGRFIGPQQRSEFLRTAPTDKSVKIDVGLISSIETRLCYCSVFDKCYVSDTRVATSDSRVRAARAVHVDRCVVPKMRYENGIWNSGRVQTTFKR